MCLITLTTDFGLSDGYVGVMKGVILSINPKAKIIDITHDIERQDVYPAALLIESSWNYFPKNTIHLVVVDPTVGSQRKIIALKKENEVFVAPDNGILSWLYEPEKDRIYHCNNPKFWLDKVSKTFHGRDIFSPIVAHISRGISLEEIGQEIFEMEMLERKNPIFFDDRIEGEIFYIDTFGNCITNIDAERVPDVFSIQLGNVWMPGKKGGTYADVSVGKPLVLIDSFDKVEVAIRNGNAAQDFGVKIGDKVILWLKIV